MSIATKPVLSVSFTGSTASSSTALMTVVADTSFTIVSWNVQNLFDYKSINESSLLHAMKSAVGSQLPELKKMTTQQNKHYNRELVAWTMLHGRSGCNPDIIVIMEPAVGKKSLAAHGPRSWHWSSLELLVSLNTLAGGDVWQVAVSEPVTTSSSKASFVEEYFVFFKQARCSKVTDKVLTLDGSGSLKFPERKPGGLDLELLIGHRPKVQIVMHHVVFGTKVSERVASVQLLGKLPELANTNVILCGDFNLDYASRSADYKPLVDKGLTCRIGAQATCKMTPKLDQLHNAYDQIFTKGVTVTASGVVNPLDEGMPPEIFPSLSDHLPVFATFTVPSS